MNLWKVNIAVSDIDKFEGVIEEQMQQGVVIIPFKEYSPDNE